MLGKQGFWVRVDLKFNVTEVKNLEFAKIIELDPVYGARGEIVSGGMIEF